MTTDLLETPPVAAGAEPGLEAETGLSNSPVDTPRSRWAKLGRVLRIGLTVLVVFLVVGNALILGLTLLARWQSAEPAAAPADVTNFRVVDDQVWRGAAPSADDLRRLADAGVTTVVDLRAEADLDVNQSAIDALGLERFHLPVRDGQLPTSDQLAAFDRIVREADGVVFVHCGAGVGRTGALVAHHLTASQQASGREALWHNLSVGPPSLEQIVFAARADDGERPGPVATGMSRFLDAPRRIWHNLT